MRPTLRSGLRVRSPVECICNHIFVFKSSECFVYCECSILRDNHGYETQMIPGANEPSGTGALQFRGSGTVEPIALETEEARDIASLATSFQVRAGGCTTEEIMTEAIITPRKNRPPYNVHSDAKIEKTTSGDHQTNDEDRHVVITYAVQPEDPDWYRERCFVLYKGRKSDDAMRTYVAAHIKMTWPPPHIEIQKYIGEMMETTTIVEPHELCATPCSNLSRVHDEEKNEDILEVYDIAPPLYDHAKHTVRIRIVRACAWHRFRRCLETHKDTQCRHTPFVITHNNENGQTTDMTKVHAMHLG